MITKDSRKVQLSPQVGAAIRVLRRKNVSSKLGHVSLSQKGTVLRCLSWWSHWEAITNADREVASVHLDRLFSRRTDSGRI